jgi:pimeloyl-[acyl-carrier protein] methyl ester esterase
MTLHVDTYGHGPDLVLVHGWGMHGGIWDGVRDTLSASHRLHVVDLPGYGASTNVEPYTLDTLAPLLARGVPDRVRVCGWSLGGQLALKWAAAFPQQVSQLVLVGATPCFTRRPDWDHGLSREVFDSFAGDLASNYEATLKRFLSLQARSGEDARQVMTELRRALFARGRPDLAALRGGLNILLQADLRNLVPEVRQPTLLIHGDYDTLVPVGAARWMAAHLPQGRLDEVRGAAHAPFLSHREKFIESIMGFLA